MPRLITSGWGSAGNVAVAELFDGGVIRVLQFPQERNAEGLKAQRRS